jgi:hypothetical protein
VQKLHIEIQGRVVLLVHGGLAYTPEEWGSILALARRPDLADLRVLVHDDNGTIDSARRAELIKAMDGRRPTAAVLTDDLLSRGVVTAIGWFTSGIKAFARADFETAARYLELTADERAFASKTIARLCGTLARKSA